LLFAIVACVESLDLGSTEQAATLPIQDFNFGNVQVGVSSAPSTFTVRPASGAQSNQVTSITENCPDFAITAPGLPATVSNVCTVSGSNCPSYVATNYDFTAVFTPTVAAQVSCVVTVVIDSTPTTFTLTGRGTEPAIRFGVSPSSAIDFGQVRVGDTSSAVSVVIRNFGSGPQPMTVSSVAFDAAALGKGFAVASGTTGSHVVAANGGSDPFTVTCAPAATGTVTGALQIATDDPAAPTTTLTVSCTGIASNLVFGPSSPALLSGTQAQKATRVGEPTDIPLTLRNTGSAPMTINSLALTGSDLSFVTRPTDGTVLGLNQTTNVVVRFSATTAVEQGTLGELAVTHDGGQTRTLNILGGALMTSMSISPDGTVDLGPVCIGNTAQTTFFALKNNPGTFKITEVTQPAPPFALAGQLPTGGPIAVDTNAVSFSATVTPTEASNLSSSFDVVTDIPNTPARTIRLTAIGLPSGVTPTPTSLDLGSISVGASSPGQMVVVTNCNPAPLTLIETVITGANQDDFEILDLPTTAILEPGTSASYVIVTTPNNPGELAATLQIRHDGGMIEVPLTGNGTGEVIDGRIPQDSTYYSCSTGRGGASLWPLLLILLGVARRRRRDRSA
jgi:MYXO-CTERM domain-containing protein